MLDRFFPQHAKNYFIDSSTVKKVFREKNKIQI